MAFVDDLLAAAVAPVASRRLGEPDALQPVLARIREDFGDEPGDVPDAEGAASAVRALRAGRTLPTRDLIRCCSAAAIPIDGVRILEDDSDAARLLAAVERLDNGTAPNRTVRKAFRALARAHFEWAPDDRMDPASPWSGVRAWLAAAARRADLPDDEYWQTVRGHAGVFQPDGLLPYRGLTVDDPAIDSLRSTFGIPEGSWFFVALFMERINEACEASDARFRDEVTAIVLELEQFPSHREWALGRLLDRYSRAVYARETQPELLALAVECWRTPRDAANFPAWKAVSDEVREMVARWLTGEIIVRVFDAFGETALAGSEAAERALFWRMWADQIDDVHVFIDSRERGDFSTVRSLVGDSHWSRISDGDVSHAFLMRIGPYSFVEFSSKGNAMYPYETADLPFALGRRSYTVNMLKNRDRTVKVPGENAAGAPIDTWKHGGRWANNFDRRMRVHLGLSRR